MAISDKVRAVHGTATRGSRVIGLGQYRYPDQVGIFDATKTLDEFSRLIQTLPASPVILVDFPAQATDFLLSAVNHFRLLEFFEHSKVRPTLLVFAADDPTAKESASTLCGSLAITRII